MSEKMTQLNTSHPREPKAPLESWYEWWQLKSPSMKKFPWKKSTERKDVDFSICRNRANKKNVDVKQTKTREIFRKMLTPTLLD